MPLKTIEEQRAYSLNWYYQKKKEDPNYHRNKCRRYRKLNAQHVKDYMRNYDLKRAYGITRKEFDELLLKQDSKCAICKRMSNGFDKGFSVDHDHLTKKIRGILCHRCNAALGMFSDSPEVLNAAINYLQRS